VTEANNTEAQTETTEQAKPAPTPRQRTPTVEGTGADEPTIPKHRYDEVNKRLKAAEKELGTIKQEQEQKQEQQAQQQGEWQQVAEKRQKKIDSLSQKVADLENQIVTDRRFRAWTQGANGIIRSDAIGDAFEYITEDEWQTVNEDDENSIRMLAQGLAERKSFLAGGPIGSGSGGSSRPVFGGSSNNVPSNRSVSDNRSDQHTRTLSSGRQRMNFNKNKRHW
jgi:hypothetical protein